MQQYSRGAPRTRKIGRPSYVPSAKRNNLAHALDTEFKRLDSADSRITRADGASHALLHERQEERALSLTRGINFGVLSCKHTAARRIPYTFPRYPCKHASKTEHAKREQHNSTHFGSGTSCVNLSDWTAPAPALPGPARPPMAPLHRTEGEGTLAH